MLQYQPGLNSLHNLRNAITAIVSGSWDTCSEARGQDWKLPRFETRRELAKEVRGAFRKLNHETGLFTLPTNVKWYFVEGS